MKFYRGSPGAARTYVEQDRSRADDYYLAGQVFDALVAAYQVHLYPTEAERTLALTGLAATSALSGETSALLMADTRKQVAAPNGATRDRLVAAGHVDDRREVVTGAGERLGVGDRVMTRRNDRDLNVANRDTWTHEHVELAYATTVHGAQGETTHTGHLLLGEHTSAAAAYVAMTRGRENNVAHLVAEDLDDACQQWVETFGRDRADLGPSHAAMRAAEDLERYAPHRPLQAALGDLRAAWTAEQDLQGDLARCESRYDFMTADGEAPAPWASDHPLRVSTFRSAFSAAVASIGVPDLHPHELRHTAASLAIASGPM